MDFFGVNKNKWIRDTQTVKTVEVLRTMMNLVPSNALQDPVWGDVQTFPFSWTDDWFAISGTSVRVAKCRGYDVHVFYLFTVPVWWPYMVLGLHARDLNIDADGFCFVVSGVVPLGWTSSVGIVQHLARKLETFGTGLPATTEIRKDMSLPGASATAQDPTWQVYLDNFAAQRPCEQSRVEAETNNMSEWHAALRAAYRHLEDSDCWRHSRNGYAPANSVSRSIRRSARPNQSEARQDQRRVGARMVSLEHQRSAFENVVGVLRQSGLSHGVWTWHLQHCERNLASFQQQSKSRKHP